MARMVPTPMLPTQSAGERKLYEGFRTQLPDDVVVYHGIRWLQLGPKAREGESDFLIADPARGLLCVEVKGGALRFDPSTRTWQQNGKVLNKNPFDQAEESMHWIVGRMRDDPRWRQWNPSFGYAVAFPDSDYMGEAHPNAPMDIVIDRRDMDDLQGRLVSIMDRWGDAQVDHAGAGMQALDAELGYRIEVIAPLGVRIDEAERRMIELTEEQSYIRDFIRRQPRLAVLGTAGSGKTLIAIQTAKWLAEHGSRTLITCFNKRLGRYMAESCAGVEGITAVHFHELAYSLARRAETIPEAASDGASDDSTYFTEVLPKALEEAAPKLDERFDAIVVDEAQDFQDAFWPALMALHRGEDGTPLYLFGDDNQNIYGGSRFPVAPNEIFGPLRKNMRNALHIQEFLAALHRGEEEPIIGGPEVGPVEVMAYEGTEDLVEKAGTILDQLRKQDVSIGDVVLLTPTRLTRSPLRNRGSLGGFPLTEVARPGGLLTSSLHAFKGLERPVVILGELGDRGTDRLVEYLYVGGSRARHQLYLLAVPDVAGMLMQLPGTAAWKA